MAKTTVMKNYLKLVKERVNLEHTLSAEETALRSLIEQSKELEAEKETLFTQLEETKKKLKVALLKAIKSSKANASIATEVFEGEYAMKYANVQFRFLNKVYSMFENLPINWSDADDERSFLDAIFNYEKFAPSEEFAKLIELYNQYLQNAEKVKFVLAKSQIAKRQKPYEENIENYNLTIKEIMEELKPIEEYLGTQPEYRKTLINKILHKKYFKALEQKESLYQEIADMEALKHANEEEINAINAKSADIIKFVEAEMEKLKEAIDLKNKFSKADKKLTDFSLNTIEPVKKKIIHTTSAIEDKKADLYAWAKLSHLAQGKIEMFLRENFANMEFSEEILEANEQDFEPEVWEYILKAKKMVTSQKFDYIEKLL